MPLAPPRHCSAGHPPFTGRRCPVCEAERKARVEAGRQPARARGYNAEWEWQRSVYLATHPVCVVCGGKAKIVDHVTPHRGNLGLFWARSNWAPYCWPCHSAKTARDDGGFGNRTRQARP